VALLAEETRPRVAVQGDDLLVILRGVNLNPGAEPDDMVSIRSWIEESRAVSVQLRPLRAVEDIRDDITAGRGPRNAADFLEGVTRKLADRMAPVIGAIDDRADALEGEVVGAPGRALRLELGELRRNAIGLRRYIAPQRDALARLVVENVDWLGPAHRSRLRETAERVTRYVEDLDAARDRAQVTQDELTARLSEQMNRNTYVLSVVAAIMLPLSLITGLLGINVGGIPLSESPLGFASVAALLVVLAALLWWVFRWRKWL
jgi:zinc transporter